MCTQVFDTEGDYSSIPELRAAGFVVLPEDYDADICGLNGDDNVCLCCVDIVAILDRSGRPYWWDAFGYSLIGPDPELPKQLGGPT